MTRILQPELLDTLPAENPEATRSRADLRRVNAWLGHRRILTRTLQSLPLTNVRRIVELGAGDGTFALSLARGLRPHWPKVELTLVDQQSLVTAETMEACRRLGWKPQPVQADVFDWLANASAPTDLIFVNLFLHHFDDARLRQLLREAAARCACFIALEPRRHVAARLACELLWMIACNRVTRHDARLSVRAGFRGQELASLWPDPGAPVSDPASLKTQLEARRIGDRRSDVADWRLREQPAGLFSHLFVAARARA